VSDSSKRKPPANVDFTETQWTVVNAAKEKGSPGAEAAMDTLCNTYWFPIYVYVRRRGYSAHDAQDLTQEFFYRVVSDKSFGRADRGKGKFRSYLLGALNHFLADEWDKKRAVKRGGGQVVSLEAAEEKYLQIASTGVSPEKAFDHRWGMILLEQGIRRLHEEFKAEKKELQFELLKEYLIDASGSSRYDGVARKLSLSPNRVAVIVYRMRERFRALLRAELAHTVLTREDLDEELRHLFDK